MPRTSAPTREKSRAPSSADGAKSGLSANSTIDASPRMLAQRQQIQTIFGHSPGVVQGFFDLAGQATNAPARFKPGADVTAQKEELWPQLKLAIEEDWKKLKDHNFTEGMVEGLKVKLLDHAFSDVAVPVTIRGVSSHLKREAIERKRIIAEREAAIAESLQPLDTRKSPPAMAGALGKVDMKGSADKHGKATYVRTTPGVDGGAATKAEETFKSDDYTKGPAKRVRKSKSAASATTPTGVQQAWTKAEIIENIRSWTCDEPLVRHMTLAVWPKLKDTEDGRKWEVKFREIDRLVNHRGDEGTGRFIEILKDEVKVKSFDRDELIKPARELLKAALLAGTKHPANQTDVVFYDTKLRAKVDASWLAPGATFKLKSPYSVAASLSMILTHWRTVLLFDWILAEDVINNGKP